MSKYILDDKEPVLISIPDVESISIDSNGAAYSITITGRSRKEYTIARYSSKEDAEFIFNELVNILSKNESQVWNRLNPIIEIKNIREMSKIIDGVSGGVKE